MSGARLSIPSPSLVVMVGVAGSGKTTLGRRHFGASQIVGTDDCRALLSDDAVDQSVSDAAFRLAHLITDERLRLGRLTVFDATSVQERHRQDLVAIAARHHLPTVAILLDLPVSTCLERDRQRVDRSVGRRIIEWQARALDSGRAALRREGFSEVHRLRSARAAERVRFEIRPLSCDRRRETGPFDIIGDVHGCAGELITLLRRLGYRRRSARNAFRHGNGRRAIFLGDLVDRGPRIVDAVRIVDRMVKEGYAFSVPGNHDVDLVKSLKGRPRSPSPGLRISLGQIDALPAGERARFAERFAAFVGALPAHLVLDGGRLAVAHAGLHDRYIGRESAAVLRFALHGETTGDVDRYGLPVRVDWAAGYHGAATLVYGHTPVVKPEFQNNTVNIDTGCVYGGRLTALRYPEMEIVDVPAARPYYQSPRLMLSRVGLRAETRARPIREVRRPPA